MTRYFAAVALVLAGALSASTQEGSGEIKLEVVKYDGLKDAILKHRGKVVYVDFWFLNCPPCKAAFPSLVDMHARRNKEGLEVITVNVTATEEENVKESLEYLKSIKATFRNLALEDGANIAGDKLNIKNYPSIYLFDRQGRWVHFPNPSKNKEEIVQTVDKFLKETK